MAHMLAVAAVQLRHPILVLILMKSDDCSFHDRLKVLKRCNNPGEVFAQTGAASRVLETDGEDMQHRAHDCYFSAAHAAKDSGIALSLAKAVGLHLPLAQATYEQYRRLVAMGKGELDKSAIAELTFKDRTPKTGLRRG